MAADCAQHASLPAEEAHAISFPQFSGSASRASSSSSSASLTLFPFICSSFASPSQGSANGCSKGAGVGRDKPDVHLAIVDSKGHKKVPQFVKVFAEQSQLYSLRLLRSRRLP